MRKCPNISSITSKKSKSTLKTGKKGKRSFEPAGYQGRGGLSLSFFVEGGGKEKIQFRRLVVPCPKGETAIV